MHLLIAGGGTGGHLFPGIALAEDLMSRNQDHRVVFVGTRRGIEFKAVPRAGFTLDCIQVGGLKGSGLMGWLRGLFRVPRAMWQSRRIIRRFRPDVVVGVGGYASGPVVLMAWLMRTPTMIMEQNALPGFTNKILGKVVRRVVVSFPDAASFFPKRKVRALGNPVRKALAENFLRSSQVKSGQDILIFGGSQGARTLNRVVPEAAKLLNDRWPGLRFVHQTGEKEVEGVRDHYQQLGLVEVAEVTPFIHDMAAAYRRSDLVICRAGATTVSELSLCRKAAVLIPFPHAADNHQEVNARALVDAGAALMVREADLSPEGLASLVGEVLADEDRRAAMEDAAGRVSKPESARDICELCLELGAQSRWRRHEEVL